MSSYCILPVLDHRVIFNPLFTFSTAMVPLDKPDASPPNGFSVVKSPDLDGKAFQANMVDKNMYAYALRIARQMFDEGRVLAHDQTVTVRFGVYEFVTDTGRKVDGFQYALAEKACARLMATWYIEKTENEEGKETKLCHTVVSAKVSQRKGQDLVQVEITFPREVVEALHDGRVISLDHQWYQMRGMRKQLYEIVHAHIGAKPKWEISATKLCARFCGAQPNFQKRYELRKLVKEDALKGFYHSEYDNIRDVFIFRSLMTEAEKDTLKQLEKDVKKSKEATKQGEAGIRLIKGRRRGIIEAIETGRNN